MQSKKAYPVVMSQPMSTLGIHLTLCSWLAKGRKKEVPKITNANFLRKY